MTEKTETAAGTSRQSAISRTTVYRLLGLPLWSVTVSIDEDELYDRMSKRFAKEMDALIEKEVKP